jgi:hypothetical protein
MHMLYNCGVCQVTAYVLCLHACIVLTELPGSLALHIGAQQPFSDAGASMLGDAPASHVLVGAAAVPTHATSPQQRQSAHDAARLGSAERVARLTPETGACPYSGARRSHALIARTLPAERVGARTATSGLGLPTWPALFALPFDSDEPPVSVRCPHREVL